MTKEFSKFGFSNDKANAIENSARNTESVDIHHLRRGKQVLSFTKMHGCGNDYIYFNCFEREIDSPEELSVRLSDRHKSIGGDGVVLICRSSVADAKMRMFNLDGSEGKMCGNAIRCVGKYLHDNGIVDREELTIETLSGIRTLWLQLYDGKVQRATVDMGKAELCPARIPVALPGERVVGHRLTVGDGEYAITCVSMGNPHCVVFCENPDTLPLEKLGPRFENHPLFPERVNTEFIEILDEHTLKMRVWERGSGETWACGTGACAAAVAAVLNGYCQKEEDITVRLKGGDLVIRYTDETVYMTGDAAIAFEGTVEV